MWPNHEFKLTTHELQEKENYNLMLISERMPSDIIMQLIDGDFNIISVVIALIHAFLENDLPVLRTMFFPNECLIAYLTIVKRKVSSGKLIITLTIPYYLMLFIAFYNS